MKRLQVLLDEREMADVRRAARRQGLTTAEWVRQALRAARRAAPEGDPKRKKLAALRASARHEFPTADLGQMLAESERGHQRRTDE